MPIQDAVTKQRSEGSMGALTSLGTVLCLKLFCSDMHVTLVLVPCTCATITILDHLGIFVLFIINYKHAKDLSEFN